MKQKKRNFFVSAFTNRLVRIRKKQSISNASHMFFLNRQCLHINIFLVFLTGSDRVPVFGWNQTLVNKELKTI